MPEFQRDAREQIELVYRQFQENEIDLRQFIQLVNMVYGDYIELIRRRTECQNHN